MVKGKITKKVFSVTIDDSILRRFSEYCEKNSINKSNLIEKQIVKYLEEKNE